MCLSQALKVGMIEMLVHLLETGLESLDNPAATKAQIVKAIKAMQRSLKYGEEVSHPIHLHHFLSYLYLGVFFIIWLQNIKPQSSNLKFSK